MNSSPTRFDRRRGRRGAALLAWVLIALAPLLGCQSISLAPGNGSENTRFLARLLERGELRVGMTGAQPPLNMRNRSGDLIGLDVDLARALADAMGVRLVLVETPFAELLTDLQEGRLDLVISSLTITPSRNARVAFAGPYLISGSSLLTRKALIPELQDMSGLNSPERTWAALEGSTGEALINEAFPLAKYVPIDDQATAVERIDRGEIDGFIADLPSVSFQLARHPDLGLATLPSPFTTEPLGIALPPNSPLFSNLVQNYLNTLDSTGQLIQMKARWLHAGDWLSEIP